MSKNSNDMIDDESSSSHREGNCKDDEEDDADIFRILLSTDNHLGYCEKDSIRGNDSFAAFEEVLRIAKWKGVDFVLFSGDLFHENKPSRLTLHRTMEILRRYCMGPNAVRFRIVSDQAKNFRSSANKYVNFEDEFYSVDLPIFSIHGNHDDPTRDTGSTEMLAALDLLAVSNLVNYFGRQDEVNNITISPILMKKGDTKVALFGLGSMRDERLNRMWNEKNVKFMRPQVSQNRQGFASDEDETEKETGQWFNIFTLHQNRDLGRGLKNCIHESMIPEWMDLVVWGHEHECLIEPTESLIGTYRITQPGSSVATSLTNGESTRKKVGLLEVRGTQFRLTPIPLSQVRGFAIKEISLTDSERPKLDPADPRIDERVSDVLRMHVNELISNARSKFQELLQEAESLQLSASHNFRKLPELKYTISHPHMVLVRLKVEHSGFTALNNQRFGGQFVSEVANPSDILLFHRKRQPEIVKAGTVSAGKSIKSKSLLSQPHPPGELNEISVEELAKELLSATDHKLDILEEQLISLSIEEFIEKENRNAISETVDRMVKKQQKVLVKRGINGPDANTGEVAKVTTEVGIRELCSTEVERARAIAASEEEIQRKRKQGVFTQGVENAVANSDSEIDEGTSFYQRKSSPLNCLTSSSKTTSNGSRRLLSRENDVNLDKSHDMTNAFMGSRPTRSAGIKGRAKSRNAEVDSDGEKYEAIDASSVEDLVNDDISVELSQKVPPKKTRVSNRSSAATGGTASSRTTTKARSTPKTRTSMGIQTFFTSKSNGANERSKRSSSQNNDTISDDEHQRSRNDLAVGWGLAQTKRSRK